MKRCITLAIFIGLGLLYSCEKEEYEPYEPPPSEWPTTYWRYYFDGTAKDSLGNPLSGVAVFVYSPCYGYSVLDSTGYFHLTACEMTSKWAFVFDETVTVHVRDTSTNDILCSVDFQSDLLIEDDTVQIDLQFPM